MTKVAVTIEARMTSSRLPGKVLMPLGGKPALQRQLDRVVASGVDEVVVATTQNPQDDPIARLCAELGVAFFRGSEEDVLGRVLGAARSVKADVIVELTGDCPLVDPAHINTLVGIYLENDYDHVSNVVERSFPDGFDVQVFSVDTLALVDKLTNDPVDRSHVSYYIYTHPEQFKLYNWKAQGEMFWPELRVTLDEKEDLKLLDEIFKELGEKTFSALDVVRLMRARPDLRRINTSVKNKDISLG